MLGSQQFVIAFCSFLIPGFSGVIGVALPASGITRFDTENGRAFVPDDLLMGGHGFYRKGASTMGPVMLTNSGSPRVIFQ